MAKIGSPLFLRGFFRNILVPDSDIARPTRGAAKRLWLVRRLIQVAVLAGLIAAGVAVAASFARNSRLVSETADLAATATRIPRRDSPALRDVDGALGQLDPLLQQLAVLDGGGAASGSWLNLGLYRGQKVRENARRVYLGRFADLVLLPYQEALRDWLPQRALPEGQDDEFYKRYRVFRMLREPRHGVAPDMSEVMRQLYREEAGAGRDPAAEERLTRHVEFAIRYAEELQPLVTRGGGREGWDHEIDAKAERYIIDHWRIDTYYREVVGDVNSRRGEWAFNLDKLVAGSGTLRQRAPDSTDQPPTIPASFTRRGWDEEVGKILGDSEALRRDSWLLPEVVKQDLAGRYGQLVQLYAEDYVAHWRAFLESVVLEAPGTLAEAENRLVDLAQGGSLYQQLLERAASDLSFDLGKGDGSPEVIAAMNRITSDFGSLHAALRRGEKGRRPLDEFLDSVMEVRKAVGEHKTGGHAAAAAAFTRGIFANDGPDRDSAIAKSLAAAEILAGSNSRSGDADCNRSLGAYLSQPALAAWQAYLNETQQYLDEKWQASVWTEFNALGGRYPLARMSTLDAPPEAFGVFFHDGGTLQSFVKQHLRPYVGDPGYAPKLVHGLGLQLTPEARKSLNAGLRLNQVLFANGESRPHCTFSVRPGQARVVPPAGLYVEKSIFRIGDQTLEYRQGQRTYKKFSWPPQDDAEVAEIKATLNQNASPCSLEMEPSFWALFRLMDAAAHAPEESMKFTLTWKVALKARPGSVVELPYEFIMEQNDHALLRGLTGVTCPEHLFN
jgi:type VI protein secretion system component VasK